ncbi:PilN domain-containing protein [Verrucomicrobiota bacterium]
MAKEQITGLVISSGGLMEWTTLQQGKECLEAVDSGRMEFADEEPAALEKERDEEPPSQEEEKGEGQADVVDDRIKKQCSLLKGNLTLGLPSRNILLRVVSLPVVSHEEMSSMVRLQADKFSPFPIENMVVSHEVLSSKDGSPAEESGVTQSVLIGAVKEEVVDSLGQSLIDTGRYPERVDVLILGWWKLLSENGHIAEKGRMVLLLVDGPVSGIAVFDNGVPLAFRSLGERENFSGEEFADEIAEEIDYTLMSLELEHGSSDTCSVSVWCRDRVSDKLEKKLKGDSARRVSINLLDTLPSVSEGLARRSAEQDGAKLDLTPDAWRSAGKARLFKRKMLISAGLLFGIWMLGVLGFAGGLQYQKSRLAFLERENEKWKEPAKEVAAVNRRIKVVKRYMDQKHSALECLREISQFLPEDGIDLTSFSYSNYEKAEEMKISGEATHVNLVYDFKKKLDESELFYETILQGPNLDVKTRRQIFDMNIKLSGGEEE